MFDLKIFKNVFRPDFYDHQPSCVTGGLLKFFENKIKNEKTCN